MMSKTVVSRAPRPYELAERLYYGEARGSNYDGIDDDPWVGDERSNKILDRRWRQTNETLIRCQYCRFKLMRVSDNETVKQPLRPLALGRPTPEQRHFVEHATWDAVNSFMLTWCENCRHWSLASLWASSTERSTWEVSHCKAIARRFDLRLPNGCASELAQYYRRKLNRFELVDPKRLELLVCDVFRANFQNAEVVHVGRPGDGGTDAFFVDANRQQWLIQVKRRSQGKEPFSTVQELAGTLLIENELRGIVVTTALGFSQPAIEAVNKLQRRGIKIELIDRGVLNRMLSPLLPRHPWDEYFKLSQPELWPRAKKMIENSRAKLRRSEKGLS
jgi:hypothetical protein